MTGADWAGLQWRRQPTNRGARPLTCDALQSHPFACPCPYAPGWGARALTRGRSQADAGLTCPLGRPHRLPRSRPAGRACALIGGGPPDTGWWGCRSLLQVMMPTRGTCRRRCRRRRRLQTRERGDGDGWSRGWEVVRDAVAALWRPRRAPHNTAARAVDMALHGERIACALSCIAGRGESR